MELDLPRVPSYGSGEIGHFGCNFWQVMIVNMNMMPKIHIFPHVVAVGSGSSKQ